MAWDAYSLFLLGGGTVGLGIGILVLALGPTRPANQILATILIAQGLFPQGIFIALVEAGAASPWLEAAIGQGVIMAIVSLGFLQLLFIGQAIPHQSVSWLRTAPGAAVIIAVWTVTIPAALLLQDRLAMPLMLFALGVALAAAVYSAVAAWLEMMSHPRDSANRSRATTYFAAFVTRDAGLAWMTIATVVVRLFGLGGWPFVVGRAIMLLSHVLIATALLRGQVLGLNRKLVAGASGAFAGAVLAIAFVVVTETIEGAVSDDDRAVGITAAVVLTLLFRPVQSAAERGLLRLFPSARPLTALDQDERASMYREQVELAWADGNVRAKERRMLDRMALSLRLDPATARRIEDGVANVVPRRDHRGKAGAAVA